MLDLKTINNLDAKTVGYFRFKKFGDSYLLTNEIIKNKKEIKIKSYTHLVLR